MEEGNRTITDFVRNSKLSELKMKSVDELSILLDCVKKEQKESASARHWVEGLIKMKNEGMIF